MKSILYTRYINYLTAGKQAELQLMTGIRPNNVFNRVYKRMDKMLKQYLKDISKEIPRREKAFKDGLKRGTIVEHEKYLEKFRSYESEVIKQ